ISVRCSSKNLFRRRHSQGLQHWRSASQQSLSLSETSYNWQTSVNSGHDLVSAVVWISDLAAFPPRASVVAGCDRTPERRLDCRQLTEAYAWGGPFPGAVYSSGYQ